MKIARNREKTTGRIAPSELTEKFQLISTEHKNREHTWNKAMHSIHVINFKIENQLE